MVQLVPSGGTAQIKQGFVPVQPGTPFNPGGGVKFVTKNPTQVVGLTPLFPCTVDDCRYLFEDDQVNKVSGHIADGVNPTYKNDFTTILIDMSAYTSNPLTVSVSFLLQKLAGGVWSTVATLNNTTNGIFYPLNGWPTHPTYTGYALNWGLVLLNHGRGTYRIKVTSAFKSFVGCLVTDCFHLRAFDCDWVHGTVKFERWITGIYGDPYISYFLHDICDILWYDSFRYNGFFGERDTEEYREVALKWGKPSLGKVELVKDEALPGFMWHSNYFKQPYHDRFSVFGMMGGDTRVSDYNINNSDYYMKRVEMVKNGGYSPIYKDQLQRRISRVDVKFRRGVQSIIHSVCCDPRAIG